MVLDIASRKFDELANYFNQNKYFYGVMMILLNIGSRYLVMDISAPFHTAILSSKVMRRILIFTVVFVATRDFKTSIILTAAFVIIALNLFNDKSSYCILPKSFKNLDTNMDGEITPDEIERAYKILQKSGKLPESSANEQKTSKNSNDFNNSNDSNDSNKPKKQERIIEDFKSFNPFDRRNC